MRYPAGIQEAGEIILRVLQTEVEDVQILRWIS